MASNEETAFSPLAFVEAKYRELRPNRPSTNVAVAWVSLLLHRKLEGLGYQTEEVRRLYNQANNYLFDVVAAEDVRQDRKKELLDRCAPFCHPNKLAIENIEAVKEALSELRKMGFLQEADAAEMVLQKYVFRAIAWCGDINVARGLALSILEV